MLDPFKTMSLSVLKHGLGDIHCGHV